ncbi:hypothetical protein SteCoe_15733 [Stentor coeruleus]|uniref:Peptidase C51 domain-containing protein n=1 Tax=Stentor coeruleus TaxID=5963 RepID=A0A1R2C383_9CILI|nr:hypothetical protein SteCoe_15733 [Stentor coeruleus]
MEKPGFGVLLGSYKGVEGYSNRKAGWGAGANFINGHFTGYKYQCVEYARRWLILAKQLTFQEISCACHIWDLDKVIDINTNNELPLIGISNGSSVPPVADALLIYSRGLKVPWGHVAIITEVNLHHNYIRIAEQNEEDRHWPGNFARQLKLEVVNGKYFIRDKYSIIGWMVYENLENYLGSSQ